MVFQAIIPALALSFSPVSQPPKNVNIPMQEVKYSNLTQKDEKIIKNLSQYIPKVLKAMNTPGLNITIARDQNIIWEAGFGYSDAFQKKETSTETIFRSGSMGKTYTGMAILQLVEKGVIKLSDTINKHLTFKVKNPFSDKDITIYHLMTHTSGLTGDAAGGVFNKSRSLRETLKSKYKESHQILIGKKPTWSVAPGTKWLYSNIGIATLGLIVENTNPEKLSFSRYVEKNIMKPLKMESSLYPPAQSKEHIPHNLWKRMSTGYHTMGDVWIPTPLVNFEEFPAGGFIATASDHLKYMLAMQNHGKFNGVQVFKPETVKTALTPQKFDDGSIISYKLPGFYQGMVWVLMNWGSENKHFYHNGGHMFGWRTNGVSWPSHGYSMVVASNEWSSIGIKKRVIEVVTEAVQAVLNGKDPQPIADNITVGKIPNGIQNLEWKASYLRGLLFMEAYRYGIGVNETLPLEYAEKLASQAVVNTWSGKNPLWNKSAFLKGIEDMNNVKISKEAIHKFAEKSMKITIDEAKKIFPAISHGGGYASLAGLLYYN